MRWPAEWEPHEAVWIGFPGNPAEWPVGLAEAQREVAAFANAIVHDGMGDSVLLICRNDADAKTASFLASDLVNIVVQRFGDIWLRDTAPVITVDSGKHVANQFCFNGWGGKFNMPGDQDIGNRLTSDYKLFSRSTDLILEGGAIDGNGSGLLITTKQCVLNPNRNNPLTKSDFEAAMRETLGVKSVCWLGDGLLNDHTDGHIDNLARFVAANLVAVPESDDLTDPNNDIFENAAEVLPAAGLEVVRIPSVGLYKIDGEVAPASYMNFYIGNKVVAVPQFDAFNDAKALSAIKTLFPNRRVVGLPAKALLMGGGSFHCISQQIPAI